jgi:hypothetical protein
MAMLRFPRVYNPTPPYYFGVPTWGAAASVSYQMMVYGRRGPSNTVLGMASYDPYHGYGMGVKLMVCKQNAVSETYAKSNEYAVGPTYYALAARSIATISDTLVLFVRVSSYLGGTYYMYVDRLSYDFSTNTLALLSTETIGGGSGFSDQWLSISRIGNYIVYLYQNSSGSNSYRLTDLSHNVIKDWTATAVPCDNVTLTPLPNSNMALYTRLPGSAGTARRLTTDGTDVTFSAPTTTYTGVGISTDTITQGEPYEVFVTAGTGMYAMKVTSSGITVGTFYDFGASDHWVTGLYPGVCLYNGYRAGMASYNWGTNAWSLATDQAGDRYRGFVVSCNSTLVGDLYDDNSGAIYLAAIKCHA